MNFLPRNLDVQPVGSDLGELGALALLSSCFLSSSSREPAAVGRSSLETQQVDCVDYHQTVFPRPPRPGI